MGIERRAKKHTSSDCLDRARDGVGGPTSMRDPLTAGLLSQLTSSRSVVAFAAHPDDVESWCAGALALAADAGAAIQLIVATSGESGSSVIATDDLGPTRETEARGAAKILRIEEPLFLRLPDGGLAGSEALLACCRDAIARHRPDLIFTFDPDRPWSSQPHSDHVAIGRAALVAAGDDAASWLFSTAAPNGVLDIEPVFERKVAARLAHRSQTSDPGRLRADWAERASSAGLSAGVPLAEEFRVLRRRAL